MRMSFVLPALAVMTTLLAGSPAMTKAVDLPSQDSVTPKVEKLAFPFISVCSGDVYITLGGVGGGGGFIRTVVHYPSIFGCAV